MDNYNNFNNNQPNDYNTTYQPDDFMDMNSGFEGGNPVVTTVQNVKSLLCEQVIAKSFLFMVAALIITALASVTTTPILALKMLTGQNFTILIGVELGVVILSNWAIARNNAVLAGIFFTIYSYLTGMTFSILFLLYTTASITSIFLVTAGIFGIMAIYGLVTKTDLSRVGNILMMGLLGIIIAGCVNIFILKSSMLDTIICIIGVLIFVGLTAYDTQKIKKMVAISNENNVLSLALLGAFTLYLDFINLFLKLLRLFGKRK